MSVTQLNNQNLWLHMDIRMPSWALLAFLLLVFVLLNPLADPIDQYLPSEACYCSDEQASPTIHGSHRSNSPIVMRMENNSTGGHPFTLQLNIQPENNLHQEQRKANA
ncbi:hypothetical protein TNCV_3186081 [Trichonephila clavipes]|nr:hypothetical protein TNCV_3186081 [Trichonephila clavipes]